VNTRAVSKESWVAANAGRRECRPTQPGYPWDELVLEDELETLLASIVAS
jgi:hypothetical protein